MGVTEVRPAAEVAAYLRQAAGAGRAVHYLPPYRAEHRLKLKARMGWAGSRVPGRLCAFIRAVVAQRNVKSEEEIAEIEKACNVTADMHMEAMRVLRPGMYEV